MRIAALVGCALLIGACAESSTDPNTAGNSDIPWSVIRAGDVAGVEPGWSTPVFIEANDGNWEEGPFISLSGVRLYFTYYPAEDLLADRARGEYVDDMDVLLSHQPFQGKGSFRAYYVSEDHYSEGGLQITATDDHYYHSNRDFAVDGKNDTDIYKNDQRLPFNGDEDARNPHYCESTGELFFDQGDQGLFVWSNGTVQPLPAPLNVSQGASFEPFLTEDCQTLYFTSEREGVAAIYRSERGGAAWSSPEKVVWSRSGVGEASLPADGGRLYFAQRFQAPGGTAHTSDLFFLVKN